ncbi:MAG: YqgE/AlgH family protein [Bryobacteraceae bacterium]
MTLRLWCPLALAVVFGGGPFAAAQSTRVEDLGVGKLLVAPRDSSDPNFAETVILIVHQDGDGAVGLIVNRRTSVPVSRVLETVPAAKNRKDPIYVGGPVELTAVLALLRSSVKPGNSDAVLPDLYIVHSKEVLEKSLAAGTGASNLHIFLGYSGWAAGQLEREVRRGGWFIFQGKAGQVFDADPDSLWSRLVARTEQQWVRNFGIPNPAEWRFAPVLR